MSRDFKKTGNKHVFRQRRQSKLGGGRQMDNSVIVELIGGVCSIISAVITGKYTVKAAQNVPESNQPKEISSKANSAHKCRWRHVLAPITIGVIVFFIISFSVRTHLGLEEEYGSPDYYVEVEGQDFGYEIFNLATLKYKAAFTYKPVPPTIIGVLPRDKISFIQFLQSF